MLHCDKHVFPQNSSPNCHHVEATNRTQAYIWKPLIFQKLSEQTRGVVYVDGGCTVIKLRLSIGLKEEREKKQEKTKTKKQRKRQTKTPATTTTKRYATTKYDAIKQAISRKPGYTEQILLLVGLGGHLNSSVSYSFVLLLYD